MAHPMRPHSASLAGLSPAAWGLLALAAACLAMVFREPAAYMYDIWMARPEYSHGILIPLVSLWLIWQRRAALAQARFGGSWWGVAIVLAGSALFVLGELSSIVTLMQYALLIVFYGLVLAFAGPAVFRTILVPLAILAFMIPLPGFLLNNFSAQLQLLSSSIAVSVMRAVGMSVYLEGNVIDLGGYQLQVAEACDGLRYLFPLMTLAFIMAYMFRAPFWKRAVLFLSSIPITILMNSLRVAVIGITVEQWGSRMAEGFLHDFQGWAVFMASAALLFAWMGLLARFGDQPVHWSRLLVMEPLPAPASSSAIPQQRQVGAPFVTAVGVLLALAGLAITMPGRSETVPKRSDFTGFPSQFDAWHGRRQALESAFLDVLKLDDYLLVDYVRESDASRQPVNVYAAWYGSQRKGQSVHSPRSCIPGGGWQIRSLEQRDVGGVRVGGAPLRVNRVLIEHGSQRQVVYYWFQQRGRVVTNEYLVKWFIFWDSLTRHRSDGALLRVTIPLLPHQPEDQADSILQEFLAVLAPTLPQYVPG